MKKIIVVVILAACMVMSGYTYAKYKILTPFPGNNNQTSFDTSSNNGQAIRDNSNKDTNTTSDSNDKNQTADNSSSSNSKNTKPQATTGSGSKKPTKTNTSVSSGSTVKVDISEQKVYVYNGNKLIRTMICSSGIENEDYKTPRGTYIINESGAKKGEWFYSNKYQEGAKYWVGFIGGTYLFHSVPMDINKNIIEEEADKLGTPASHGCIRLNMDDAYWFYNNIKSGTKLVIQD